MLDDLEQTLYLLKQRIEENMLELIVSSFLIANLKMWKGSSKLGFVIIIR